MGEGEGDVDEAGVRWSISREWWREEKDHWSRELRRSKGNITITREKEHNIPSVTRSIQPTNEYAQIEHGREV